MLTFIHTRKNKTGLRGFTLIELAIVLGVVGLLTAGLFRLMSAGGSQTKDQATAQQQQQLIAAVTGFLADTGAGGGQAILRGMGINGTAYIPLPVTNGACTATVAVAGGTGSPYSTSLLCNYLPPGFVASTTNPYGQTYTIQILKDGTAQNSTPQYYSFMIATAGSTAIPDVDGGRISGLIGGDGGFIYNSNICGGTAGRAACGTMGAWSINDITAAGPSGYGFTGGYGIGSVASRTFVSPLANSSNIWLARVPVSGDTATYSYNTMSAGTNLYMGTGSNIYMYPYNGSGSNALYLSNGSIQGNGSTGASAQVTLGEDGTANPNPLIQLSTLCSLIVAPTCTGTTYAIDITQGDIYLNGAVIAGKLYSASDARLKTNIKPIASALDNLMKIDPVSFKFKSGGSQSMGVIAQQLETVYPELVSEQNGHKYVEYNGLIGPLIGAVQELKRQNDDLREQLHQQDLREQSLEHAIRTKSATP